MNVLLIIDMQVATFERLERYDADGVIKRINALSENVRRNGGRVIFIQHGGKRKDENSPRGKGYEILPSLNRDATDLVVGKTICDAFYKTDLKQILDHLTMDELIVSGCATDFCVDTTVRSAASLGYDITVVSDCHTTADRPNLNAKQVIAYFNWLWTELIVPSRKIRVLPSNMLL